MNEASLKDMCEYYSKRLHEHGPGVNALQYPSEERQQEAFAIAVNMINSATDCNPGDVDYSVLDVGCGLGDLCLYLGGSIPYTGLDINPEMIQIAQRRLPKHYGPQLRTCDILSDDGLAVEEHDFVFSIAVLSHKPKFDDSESYLRRMVTRLYELARIGAVFDLFSSRVSYHMPYQLHVDPAQFLTYCYTLTSVVAIRNDYSPYRFMVYLGRDNLGVT